LRSVKSHRQGESSPKSPSKPWWHMELTHSMGSQDPPLWMSCQFMGKTAAVMMPSRPCHPNHG
jgi:hypothetical protein